MKRLSSILVLTALFLGSVAPAAFANVVFSPTTGRPVAVYSNPGSPQGIAHRSPQGTSMKTTHDGVRGFDGFTD